MGKRDSGKRAAGGPASSAPPPPPASFLALSASCLHVFNIQICLYTLSLQFGVVLVTASIVDTFFVRAVLVPALLFMAAESNWWPGKMPPVIHPVISLKNRFT